MSQKRTQTRPSHAIESTTKAFARRGGQAEQARWPMY
jgi:hypothetical protein